LRLNRQPSRLLCKSYLFRSLSTEAANTLQHSDLLKLQLDEAPKANTQDTELVDRFLHDAYSWIDLRRKLYNQVETTRVFCQKYEKHRYDDHALSNLTRVIDGFAADVNARIDKFDISSSTLIQLVRG
jgi:hypothetical protein